MTNIRPSADLRNNYKEISSFCKETGMPVYITVNGHGDTVLLDLKTFDEMYQRINVMNTISKSIKDIESGNLLTNEEVFDKYFK